MIKQPFSHPAIIPSSPKTMAMIEEQLAQKEVAAPSLRAADLNRIIDRRLNHVHQAGGYPSLTCFVLGTLLPNGASKYRIGWVTDADMKEGLYTRNGELKKAVMQRIFGSSQVYQDDAAAEVAAQKIHDTRPECNTGIKIIHTAQPWPS